MLTSSGKVLEESPLAGTHRGREEVRAYVEEWLNTFGDVRLAIEELVEVNDHVSRSSAAAAGARRAVSR